MRGRVAWFVGGIGLGTAVMLRRLRLGRPQPQLEPAASTAVDSRAQELRQRLEESRSLVEERDEFEGGETTIDLAEPAPADPAERRRRIHEHGRAAAEEMRGEPGA